MANAAAFWDRVARKYAQRPIGDLPAYEQTMERTRAHLTPDQKVLEVGCGTGSTALLLAPSVASMTASDVSAGMIAIAREKPGAEVVRFATAGLGDAALEAGGYDVVLAFNLLHLMQDTDGAIRQLLGLVRPGGLVISKTVCLAETHGWLRPVLPLMRLIGRAPYVRFMRIAELEAIFEAAGLDIVETGTFPARPPSRFIVARRR